MSNPTVRSIILATMEIEAGRKLIGKTIKPDDKDGGLTSPSFDGHWTNWGWTEATLKAHGIKTHPRDLTFKTAFDLYERLFFARSGAKAVFKHHPWLARVIFNYGVHAGYNKAAEHLQRLLNLHNNQGLRWKDLLVDGLVGPKTTNALKKYLTHRDNNQGNDVIFVDYVIMMGAFYQELSFKNDKYEKFHYGWLKRATLELQEYFQR